MSRATYFPWANPMMRAHSPLRYATGGTLSVLLACSFPVLLQAQTVATPPTTMQAITVTGSAPLNNDTPPAYAGGLVARGGQAGVLGNMDYMDMPFTQTSYTAKLIESQQARTLGDVLKNDASVQTGLGFGNQAESFVIRGLPLYNDDLSFNGLYGILPRQILPTEMVERVEVFKGASAFLNGAAPGGSGLGGLINIQPKRATDDPLTRGTLDYTSRGQVGGGVDIGRRWGEDNRWGIRVNAAYRDGETEVRDSDMRSTVGAVGLDYRGDKLRASLDAGYQRVRFDRPRPNVNLSGPVPDAPGTDVNYGQPWSYSDLESTFSVGRVEYDLAPSWTSYAAIGISRDKEDGVYSSVTVDGAGNGTAGMLEVPYQRDTVTGEIGLRGEFDTGSVGHRVNLAYSALNTTARQAWEMAFSDLPAISIYEQSSVPRPATELSGGDMDDPNISRRTQLRSLALSDTLSLLDGDVLLTLGGRYQAITDNGYDITTTEQEAHYHEAIVTPAVGLVVRPWDTVSLYANYIEGLTQGGVAPLEDTTNPGEVLAPYRTKQFEAGVKVDLDNLGGSLGVFQIQKPEAYTDPATGVFGLNGKQRNRGIELNIYGEPIKGWRLTGGVTYMQPKLRNTAGGLNDGNNAAGVSRFIAVMGSEWDVGALPGLSLQAQVRHQGGQYTSASNEYKTASWTRLDLGATYRTQVSGHNMTLRAAVDNVTDRRYWATVGTIAANGSLTQGRGRIFKLSMSADF
ncbi:TonB-dependent receptor [Pusillimonas sp.]|uniref:TonB-dependent receptor n=1 Tax=Pusillimonas sp. TaxID=3040095 RepID=UPI0037C81A71